MDTIFLYMVRASIAAAIFYTCYKLFISKTTFHNLNRAVLLIIFGSTLLLPFVSISLPEISLFQRQDSLAPSYRQLLQAASEGTGAPHATAQYAISGVHILTILYLLGVLFFMLRYAVGLIRMSRLVKNTTKEQFIDGTTLCVSSDDIAPFSWMNTIVIATKDFGAENSDIISHEKSHVDRKHSIDMLFVNVYCTLFWFNPFAWLLRNELRNTHEYQADLDVTSGRSDLKAYQLLLIRHCVGEHKFSTANNFELNNLQKRIQMIMRTKSTNKAKWLYSSFISALLVTLVIFSADSLQAKNDTKKATVIESAAIQADETYKNDSADAPQQKALQIKIRGTGKLDDDTKTKLQSKTKGEIKQIIVHVDSTSSNGKSKEHKDVLVYLDGKEISQQELHKMDVDKIDNVSVYKGDKAKEIIDLQGKEPKDGVIIVTSKTKKGVEIEVSESEKQPLYIIDGKEMDPKQLNKVSPHDIKSVSVLKDKSATSVYGEKGKNGVIIIVTKKEGESEKDK